MRVALTVRDADGLDRDVMVVAPAGATLADVSPRLGECLGTVVSALWRGTRRLSPAAPVGGPDLGRGDTVQLRAGYKRDLPTGAVLCLHVVGGPDAGLISALPRGVTTIGRAPSCDVELTDPDVSRQHMSMTVTAAGVSIRDLGSTNGITLDGRSIDPDGSEVRPGQLMRLGESLLATGVPDEPAAGLRSGRNGARSVNRPPRFGAAEAPAQVNLPTPPASPVPQRVQWLAALVPAAAGTALAVGTHNPQFLAFLLLSPLVVVGTAMGDRLHWRRNRRRNAATFQSRSGRVATEVAELLDAEARQRRRTHPDPAAILRTATIPDCRLWERQRTSEDALNVRLGSHRSAAKITVRDRTEPRSAGTVDNVPAWIDLRRGPLGIAGPRGLALGTARWAIGQLATLHSPADVDLGLLLSDDAGPAWTWARWLPHLGDRIASTPEERHAMVTTLLRAADERMTGADNRGGRWSGRWLVLVVDRSGSLTDLPDLARLLRVGPNTGITAICLDDDPRHLPTACNSVATVTGETGSRLALRRSDDSVATEILQDRVNTRWADSVARALASLVDAGSGGSSTLPDSCRLTELFGLGSVDGDAVLRLWRTARGLCVPLGSDSEGPVAIDLNRDGPHTLVAGTTGSGKSELLQSLVMSLALSNPPDAVSFLLIDYKGGAALADCARLPHTVGLVTDLDPHLTRRALRSLDAELRRREKLFAHVNAADLDAYRAVRTATHEQLTRLVLIVDEFAALAEELPDFVTGLVNIAQRGRSLGIHLVLATQRPGGVISPEIRANTSLRIALRMTDPGESSDVIGGNQAAAIDKSRPGRAFVRSGSSVREMQTARVSAMPTEVGEIAVIALDEWGRAPVLDSDGASARTDAHLIVEAICEAAERAGAPPPRRPWLSALPEILSLGDGNSSGRTDLDVGLLDQPDAQCQRPLYVDLADGGAVLVAGSAGSGRTTTLRTIAVRAACNLGPDELQMYTLDCAGGGLRMLDALPHSRTTVTRDDMATADRLLRRLAVDVTRRQTVLATTTNPALPYVLLLVDGWEGFAAASDEYDTGQTADVLLGLVREAASARMTIVLSGGRSSLAPRVAGNITRRFILRLADRGDYALAGIASASVPISMPPGRALRADDGAEIQMGFFGDGPEAHQQAAAITRIAARHQSPASGVTAGVRIAPLPIRVEMATLAATFPDGAGGTLLGAGGDAAEPVTVDLFAGDGRWLVAGPPRSGRTTVLLGILRQTLGRGIGVLVAAPRRSPLAAECRRAGIRLIDRADGTAAIASPGRVGSPRLILVDDSEAFLDTPVGDALTVLAKGAPEGVAIVAAGRSDELALTYRGVAAEVRRSRTGLLLGPAPGDGDLFGVRLPRTRTAVIPGRGILIADELQLGDCRASGGVIPLQIALP